MDVALNNQQRLICHKTQPTNQPTKFSYCKVTELKVALLWNLIYLRRYEHGIFGGPLQPL